MKTAISVPDETFAQVEAHTATLGMSRSEFFTRAAERYLAHLDSQALTSQIDAAVQVVGSDESGDAAVAAGRRRLREAEDSGW